MYINLLYYFHIWVRSLFIIDLKIFLKKEVSVRTAFLPKRNVRVITTKKKNFAFFDFSDKLTAKTCFMLYEKYRNLYKTQMATIDSSKIWRNPQILVVSWTDYFSRMTCDLKPKPTIRDLKRTFDAGGWGKKKNTPSPKNFGVVNDPWRSGASRDGDSNIK